MRQESEREKGRDVEASGFSERIGNMKSELMTCIPCTRRSCIEVVVFIVSSFLEIRLACPRHQETEAREEGESEERGVAGDFGCRGASAADTRCSQRQNKTAEMISSKSIARGKHTHTALPLPSTPDWLPACNIDFEVLYRDPSCVDLSERLFRGTSAWVCE